MGLTRSSFPVASKLNSCENINTVQIHPILLRLESHQSLRLVDWVDFKERQVSFHRQIPAGSLKSEKKREQENFACFPMY